MQPSDSTSRLQDDVYKHIMELGILHNSPPSTKRGCRAGRLHRLWHGLPPAPWPCTRSQHHSVPSRNLHPLMVPPFLQPHPDLQSAVGNAPLSSKHPAQLPTTDCLLSIISLMGGQPSDAPALSPPSPLQQGGQSSNAPALLPPSPLPQGGQPIALALSPPSPPPQGGQPSDAPGLSPSSSTLLLCPSDSTLNICHFNSQSAVKTDQTAEAPTQENLTQPLVPGKEANGGTRYQTLGNDQDKASGQRGQSPAPGSGSRNLGVRLQLRQKLLKRRRWLVNVEFVMAITGILLMVVDNELYYADRSVKDTTISFLLKLAITITTLVLLGAICLYYQAGIELRMFDDRVDDPLAVTPMTTWLSLALELVICAIHPFPGNVQADFLAVDGSSSHTSVDGILSVLMMLRLYLVGKFIVVHSQLLTDPHTQSVAAVSHVKVNINFVFKAALNKHPAEVIAAIILAMYAVSVWSMRTCELYYTSLPVSNSYSESMWLSAITFLTVGYGDLTPNTHCGRFIAVCTAMMGLSSTALLVAVIARKLEQTHQERYVYNFLVRVHLRNRFKAAAADVVKLTLKLWTLRRRKGLPVSAMDRTVLQWRLRSAIRTMRSTRAGQAELEEASVGLSEVCQSLSVLDRRQRAWESGQREVLATLREMKADMEILANSRGGGGGGDGGGGGGGGGDGGRGGDGGEKS
ncbi:hypothetical protein ACOMHN_045235 [Nucella lapillus]